MTSAPYLACLWNGVLPFPHGTMVYPINTCGEFLVADGIDMLVVPVQQNSARISNPDTIPTTASRPPLAQSRPAMTAPPPLAPMPMPSIISPTTTALPMTSLATSLPQDTSDGAPAVRATLIKPSFFVPPPLMPAANNAPSAPPLPSSASMQPSHGAPLLQPFPPPNPPPSLAPALQYSGPITKDGVREALNRLVKVHDCNVSSIYRVFAFWNGVMIRACVVVVQNENFIDMVYREMMNAHSF